MEIKSIKDLYAELFITCSNDSNFMKNSHFVAMRGEHYINSDKKVMIIGRAPNGWKRLDTSSKDGFSNDAANEFDDIKRWGKWIKCYGNKQYAIDETTGEELQPRYCVSGKPFWSYSKAIYFGLTNQKVEGLWQHNIAWSNLYKVSPSSGYNPDVDNQKMQLQPCIAILKKELEELDPDYVLFMTGYDWFEPFKQIFESINDKGERNCCRGADKNEHFVECTARFGKSKIVVACRPEHRIKDKYVGVILRAFEEMI